MKREFDIEDVAHISGNGVRGIGFMIKPYTPVRILGYHKIRDDAGAWMYDIAVKHPKTGEEVVLEQWVNQFRLMTKEVWVAYVDLRASVGRPVPDDNL